MSVRGFCCFRSKKSCSPPPEKCADGPSTEAVVVRATDRTPEKADGDRAARPEDGKPADGEGGPTAADSSRPSTTAASREEAQASVDRRQPTGTQSVRTDDISVLVTATDVDQSSRTPGSHGDAESTGSAGQQPPTLKSPPISVPPDGDLPSPEVISSCLAEAKQALASGKLSRQMEAQLSGLVARLEAVTSRLESVAASRASSGSAAADEVSPFVVAFDKIIDGPIKQFIACSEKIGGDVKTQALIFKDAVDAQRQFLVIASKSKSPSQEVLVKLLEPTSKKLQEIEEFVSKNRKSEFFNHLSAISSSAPALGWVTVTPTPGPFVKEMADSGQFYLNRVLRDFKEKDKVHGEWAAAWKAALSELQAYIKQFHTTGLAWNPQGGDASPSSAAPPAPASGGAPPPPPAGGVPPPPPPGPPPANLLDDSKASADDTEKQRNALFAEISRGTEVTKGLRKVTDDMKTHKNPSLRLQTPQPYKPKPSPKPAVKTFGSKKVESVKPAKCALEDKKWIIEYQQGNKNIVISDTNLRQTVYIFKCENSTIQIKGKVNSIAMDSCKKTGLVFDDVISSVDFVNCTSVQAQVTGKVNTVNIDKTDGCMMYLSKDSIEANIVTAKSTEMNILVPDETGEFKEFALPEQFRSVWNGKRFVTEPTDLVG